MAVHVVALPRQDEYPGVAEQVENCCAKPDQSHVELEGTPANFAGTEERAQAKVVYYL